MKELAELKNKYLDSSNELENLFVKTLHDNNINRDDIQCILLCNFYNYLAFLVTSDVGDLTNSVLNDKKKEVELENKENINITNRS